MSFFDRHGKLLTNIMLFTALLLELELAIALPVIIYIALEKC